MRKVLAITVALMLAAMVLTPAMGYTIQSAGNQSYTAQSSERMNYTVSSGTPAHELTLAMMPIKTISGPAVQTTRVASSFKAGRAVPYSIKLDTGVKAAPEGIQIAKEPARLGEGAPAETEPVVEAPPVEAPPVNETPEEAPVVEAPVEEPMFSISGFVFDDVNGNGAMDENETALANWTVALEQPAGTVIANATTMEDGSYSFMGLLAGDYAVSEVLPMGWALIAPVDGKHLVTLTDADATGLNFANQLLPVPEAPVEPAPENATVVEEPVVEAVPQ